MPMCCVPNCHNQQGFHFPADPAIKKKWVIAVKRDKFIPTDASIVCRDHFVPTDFATYKDFIGMLKTYDYCKYLFAYLKFM